MCPGLSDSLENLQGCRKTAVIDRELNRLNADIAALQETRLADSGSLKETFYTFLWQGGSADAKRERGVGFAVRNSLLSKIVPSTGTDRILALRLQTKQGLVNFLCIYAPSLCSPAETKDRFYEELDRTLKTIPPSEQLFLMGDFNARVGADNDSWSDCLGCFGVGKLNENGQRLLELCCHHHLCVTNTFFQTKPLHRVSWRHPRSSHWHQLDLIITRRKDLNCVKITRTYHSADCDTDHSLVLSKIQLMSRIIHHTKQRTQPRVNANYTTACPELRESYCQELVEALSSCDHQSASDSWDCLRKTIFDQGLATFGKRGKRNSDWFEASTSEILPFINAKREALLKYKAKPSAQNSQTLKEVKRMTQKVARQCANIYWQDLASSIETASLTGNIRSMYDGIKLALGPQIRKTAPLKSKTGEVITERAKQLDRWAEHYTELYSTINSVTDTALDSIRNLDVMDVLDDIPTRKELSDAIDQLACWKAPGEDGITPDLIKLGKPALMDHLYDLLCLCWEERAVPQDMRDAKIVTLYKNKGDRSDCNSYRGISLLSIVGKVYARVALGRLQVLAERIYPESQCGFRKERSTVDMIFSVRQLQEKCREQQQPLYMAFVDLTKAFDYVSRDGLFKILQKIGCPPTLLSILISFHANMHCTVCYDGDQSRRFPIHSGVKQGCVLAPTLFGIFFSILLSYAFESSTDGIYIRTRADADLFNLAHLRAKRKVTSVLLREMLFADDAALVSNTEQGLQRLINHLSKACMEFGVTISIKKTEVMGQQVPSAPEITICGKTLANVNSFKYLGATLTCNASLDAEIDARIAKAAGTMSRLSKRVWSNNLLTLHTKLSVYAACVISTLLYGSESWTLYTRQERRLNNFHLRCLRRILGITWEQRIPDTDVLEQAKQPSLHAMLQQRRLRWIGHVHRMPHTRLPRAILYSELASGKRTTGRPLLRYKDVCKQDLAETGIGTKRWQQCALDRDNWREAVTDGVKKAEEKRQALRKDKRRKRKEAQLQPSTDFLCPACRKDCHSRIGLCSHTRRCRVNAGADHHQH